LISIDPRTKKRLVVLVSEID